MCVAVYCVQEVEGKAFPSSAIRDFLHLLAFSAAPPKAHSSVLCAEPSQRFCFDSAGGQELLSYIRKSAEVSLQTASQHPWASEDGIASGRMCGSFVCHFFPISTLFLLSYQ